MHNNRKQIPYQMVRLIDESGMQLGIVATNEALQIASEKGLDLHVVQPEANPPVARIMDYGRFKFEEQKRSQDDRRKHPIVDVKEIKLRYNIDKHDYEVKLRKCNEFLNGRERIKVIIVLRGREIRHADMAIRLASRFADDLQSLSDVEREPILEGKSVIMRLAPKSS
jgi:translation initiation factor IF-3